MEHDCNYFLPKLNFIVVNIFFNSKLSFYNLCNSLFESLFGRIEFNTLNQ